MLLMGMKISELEWLWMGHWPSLCMISQNTTAFGANCVKFTEVRCTLSATKCQKFIPLSLIFGNVLVYEDDTHNLCSILCFHCILYYFTSVIYAGKIWLLSSISAPCPTKYALLWFFASNIVIFNANLPRQLLSASPSQCCYFTL